MLSLDLSAIAQLVVFLCFLVAINSYLMRPLIESLVERDRRIEGTRRDADRMAREAEEREAEFMETMRRERDAAIARRDELRDAGRAEERALIEQARAEVAATVDAAFARLRGSREEQWRELQGEAQEIARLIAGKTLGREVS